MWVRALGFLWASRGWVGLVAIHFQDWVLEMIFVFGRAPRPPGNDSHQITPALPMLQVLSASGSVNASTLEWLQSGKYRCLRGT